MQADVAVVDGQGLEEIDEGVARDVFAPKMDLDSAAGILEGGQGHEGAARRRRTKAQLDVPSPAEVAKAHGLTTDQGCELVDGLSEADHRLLGADEDLSFEQPASVATQVDLAHVRLAAGHVLVDVAERSRFEAIVIETLERWPDLMIRAKMCWTPAVEATVRTLAASSDEAVAQEAARVLQLQGASPNKTAPSAARGR